MAEEFGRIFTRRLPAGTDFVFAPMSSTQIAFLETSIPIVYSSDTTFALLSDYYPEYSGLSRRYREEADEIESLAIARAKTVSYPSDWAACSALTTYGARGDKVHVVPWGANLDEVPRREEIEPAKAGPGCRLFFLGKDWERKGGPLACEIVLELRRRGLAAHLTVIGCDPGSRLDPSVVTIVGAIDKSDPQQRRKLSRLLLRAHFLLQPSRHESLGVVYCEASAHGTPSIATDTGGIASVVFNHENGFRFPLSAGAGEYADLISRFMADQSAYSELVASTRRVFETRLNWDAWGRRMGEVMATGG
jgi:YD repeat-containing protein